MAEFVTVGRPGDVPEGEVRAFEVEGTRVAVARVDGSFHAFDDTCTHQLCSLADGDLEATAVICPCHGSEFDVTSGAVLAPPAVEPVRTFAVRVEGDALQIEA
ncbi:MAG TPA: non-heme iron oxygenase ferredoxin subunit [Actinomycetota bacterium]|nr:non-heme iron oxygenase ferredoxin subunit [Actinomycetota bacterium]